MENHDTKQKIIQKKKKKASSHMQSTYDEASPYLLIRTQRKIKNIKSFIFHNSITIGWKSQIQGVQCDLFMCLIIKVV